MRGNYETARRWQETFSRDKGAREWDKDTIEFVPTHMMSGHMVMELGRTPNDLVHIQHDDGSRSKVNPASLQPLPEDK